MTVRAYKLHLQTTIKVWLVVLGLISFVVPAVMVFMSFREGEPPVVFAGMLVVVFAFIWYSVASTPHTINVLHDQRIEIISILRSKKLHPSEIKSIQPSGGQLGWLCLRHSNGKVNLLQQFTGFHVFLSELGGENPDIQIVGC